ncbi:MAG TPA: fused MFS/spermidine synthase [Azospirillaceae bacterium]|nr:fused MFS/spermidine synthase [Azospirillaceae bacterium]
MGTRFGLAVPASEDVKPFNRVGDRGAVHLVTAAFFLSGVSALTYQTAWQRILGLLGGADSLSAAVVVSAFLLGLGVGSLVGALVADRLRRRTAFLAFAACEVATAVLGVASVPALYDLVFGQLAAAAPSLGLLFAISFAALLPPTLLMGMTLPLLARAVVQDVSGAAPRLGVLYGANTLGAAAGALATGLVLIAAAGYQGAVFVGAALNMVVAVSAVVAAARVGNAPDAEQREPRFAATGGGTGRLALWCAIVFASGFLIVALEVVWVRVLGAMMQSHAAAFPLVLAGFLAADAAGLFLGAVVVHRMRDPLRLFLLLQGAVAVLALGTLFLLYAAHGVYDLSAVFVDGTAFGGRLQGGLRIATYAVLVGVVVCPPALLLGMTFPISQAAVQDDPALVGQRVGLVQLANILGNTVGGAAAGLLLLGSLGTVGTLTILAVLAGFITLGAWGGSRRIRLSMAGMLAMLVLLVAAFPWNADFWARLHGAGTRGAIVAEDRTAVAVVRNRDGVDSLYVGGKWQSDAHPFRPVQAAMGITAGFARAAPSDVLLIGLGSGGTLYSLLSNPDVHRVRLVELAPPVLDVVEASSARPGGEVLRTALHDRRLEVRIADGRHSLFTDPRHYDVIVAETVSPRTSHSGLLYSVEFFRQVRARLNPGGIAVQWNATPRTEATFTSVFPHVVRVGGALLGSDEPIATGAGALAAAVDERVSERLLRAGVDPAAVRAWFFERPEHRWAPGDPRPTAGGLNTDLFPRDEYGVR